MLTYIALVYVFPVVVMLALVAVAAEAKSRM
jgi:hypothetical protein